MDNHHVHPLDLDWRQKLQNFMEHSWKTTIKPPFMHHVAILIHFHKCVSSPSSLSWGEQVEIHLCRSSADGQQFVLLWQILAGEQLLDLPSQWFGKSPIDQWWSMEIHNLGNPEKNRFFLGSVKAHTRIGWRQCQHCFGLMCWTCCIKV